MKRQNFMVLLLLFLTGTLIGQVPTGYYNNAQNKQGVALKSALYNIIKGHTEYPYTSSGTDVWDILKATDKDPNNANNVILLYSGRSVNAAQEYNSGSGWTREHVWAKSRGDFGTGKGAGTDVHHLRPADISVNSARNNRWFGDCNVPVYDNGVLTGSYKSNTSWVWQPRDEVKGDVARMMFYMATRYEGDNGEPDLELIDYIPSNQYTNSPIHAKISTLLDWHNEDPVDAAEEARNDVIYSYQGNRNPFIDHPEYACDIWGGTCTGSGSGGNGGGGTPTSYLETFDLSSISNSYTTGSFTGNHGITWNYVVSRHENNYGIDGKGVMLRRSSSNSKVYSGTISGGIASLSFDLRKGFTGKGNRRVDVYINGSFIGSSVSFDDTQVRTFSASNINVSGDFTIEIRNATLKQVVVDNIAWTSYSGSNKTSLTTGINEQEAVTDVVVWPNPVSTNLNVSFTLAKSKELNVQLIDLNGRIINKWNELGNEGYNQFNYGLNSSLSEGFYVVVIEGDNGVVEARKRILIQE